MPALDPIAEHEAVPDSQGFQDSPDLFAPAKEGRFGVFVKILARCIIWRWKGSAIRVTSIFILSQWHFFAATRHASFAHNPTSHEHDEASRNRAGFDGNGINNIPEASNRIN